MKRRQRTGRAKKEPKKGGIKEEEGDNSPKELSEHLVLLLRSAYKELEKNQARCLWKRFVDYEATVLAL